MQLLNELAFEIEDIGFNAFCKTYQNASDYNLTFYDAAYITLMQKHNCQLITADKKLYNKVKNAFAKIKLLE